MGMKRASGSGGAPWHIYTSSKQPDLAWELMKWIAADTDAQVGVWTEWKWGLPASRKVWADPRVAQPRNHPLKSVKMLLDPLEKNHAAFHEVNAVWGDWIAAFSTPFTAAMRGEQGLRTAIETAQRDVQTVLDTKLKK